MKYRVGVVALACALVLAACGGGGGSSPGTPVTPGGPTPAPTATPAPAGAPVLHTVAAWRGATHSTTASSTAGAGSEPIELGVPNSVSLPVSAATATLQAYAADASGNPVATSGTFTVSIANGALATVQSLSGTSTGAGFSDVATVAAAGTVAGTTTLTVTAPGASSASLPIVVYASLGVESSPSRDASFAWALQNGALVPASGPSADVTVGTARTSQTAFTFPYGYERFPVATPFASIADAANFVSAGTLVAASDLAANPAAYGTIVFKTANGEYVKARVVAATCLGADTTLCDGGATLDAIALPSTGGIFPY